jgi:excisionase family DNA binding protein
VDAKRKLTPKEAADYAGVSDSMIYQWCDERRLAHYRVGGKGRRGKILIDPDDLDAVLASCRIAPAAADRPVPQPRTRHLT